MNYYERHLGDYARDTAHLSMLEHGAYGLLLDRYYATEQGIPADQAHRVARAKSKDERAAVDAVLAEFFTLEDGAYVQARVARELVKFHELEPDREAKRENEKERQRRTRERRKLLFDELRTAGVVPQYDAPMSELQSLLSRVTSQPVTRDATATQTPIPVTSNQLKTKTARKRAAPAALVPVDVLVEAGFDEDAAAEFIAHKSRIKAPLTERAWADHLAESRKAGWHPMQAAIKVIAKNWRGFEAKYVASEARPDWHDKKAAEAAKWIRGTSLDRSTQNEWIDDAPLAIR